jgi:acyl-CoA synthetase (NDP forming)
VALVTNAGGPAILAADACEAAGLRVEPLAAETQRSLSEGLRPEASVANPVDMIASATAADYERTVATVLEDPGVDAVIAIFVRPLATRAADVAEAIESAARRAGTGKPVLAAFMGADAPPPPPPEGGVARFTGPDEAARALAHAVDYGRHRARPADPPPELGVDADAAAAVVAAGLGRGGGWLAPQEVETLLRAYGVPLVRSRVAGSPEEAVRDAAGLGGEVALKAIAPGLVHKSDVGGVRLGVPGPDVERAARELGDAVRAAGHEPEGFLVQEMAPGGAELLVGVVGDPAFGPLVAAGSGGETAELVGDVQVRLAPLGRREAAEMLRALRTFPLLDGFRGRPRADVAAVEDVLVRVSRLAADHPAIAELDCNPLIVGSSGALVVDARVRLEAPPQHRPVGALDR